LPSHPFNASSGLLPNICPIHHGSYRKYPHIPDASDIIVQLENDQLINVVDCRGLMVEILIDPKKPIHPPSSCGKGGCNRDQCSASPYLLKDVWFQGWGLIGRY
jgi:hypothetical protein